MHLSIVIGNLQMDPKPQIDGINSDINDDRVTPPKEYIVMDRMSVDKVELLPEVRKGKADWR